MILVALNEEISVQDRYRKLKLVWLQPTGLEDSPKLAKPPSTLQKKSM
jgi:hypothetical protein